MEFTIGQNSSLPLLKLQVVKDGILKVSSKGISVAEFDGEGFTTKYYLVQIDTKD